MTEEEQKALQENTSAKAEEVNTSNIIEKILSRAITKDDISDDVYRSYIRSVLGGSRFTMSFGMFDNALQIEYSEVSVANSDKYNKLVAKNSSSEYLLQKLAALVYIRSIKTQEKVLYTGDFQIPDKWLSDDFSVDDLTKAIEETYINTLGFLNEAIHRVLPLFWSGFNQILTLLVAKGAPTSF